jgi:hypothetical protein
MQTLERDAELAFVTTPTRRKRHPFAWVAVAVALVVVTGLVVYAIASPHTVTRVVVRNTAPPPAPAVKTAPIDDRGFSELDNGFQAETGVFFQPMDDATKAQLQHQLVLARSVAMQYPTVAAAEAAGWHRAGPYAPGLGVHYFHWSDYANDVVPEASMNDANVLHPASLIFDGTQPTSKIAGLMYYSASNRIPKGFAGANDIWHYHTNVCIKTDNGVVDTPFGADTTVTKALCDGVGGSLIAKTQYMLHAWVVPGYDSPEGMFSHLNEALTCRDGTYHTIDLSKIGSRASVCVDGSE